MLELTILAVLFIMVFGIWMFAEIADEVTEGDSLSFDEWVLTSLRQTEDPSTIRGPGWITTWVEEVTALGGTAVVTLITVVVIGYLLLFKDYRAVGMVLIAVVGGALLVSFLKSSFGRVRPDVVPRLMEETSLSFPSGHASMSAILYLSLAALLVNVQPRRRVRIYIITVAVLLTIMIGLSRVWLGVHYPTDVLAGWSFGLAWASFCYLIIWYFRQRSEGKQDYLQPE